jgi:hypothetical protein
VINNPIDERTVHFKFPLTIFIQLDKQLQKHSLYPYAIDLLTKNKFQLLHSIEKVK